MPSGWSSVKVKDVIVQLGTDRMKIRQACILVWAKQTRVI